MEQIKEGLSLRGKFKLMAIDKYGKTVYTKEFQNMIVNVGKDSILKYLGNITGGGYANQIGVGDNNTAAALGQTDLQASSNKLWKNIDSASRSYIRPTLIVNTTFDFSEANWTWHELGLRDNQSTPVMWARQVDATPFTKTSSVAVIAQWELSL